MAKSKLEQVLEYLINHEEEKAREALHTVIVEKARNIHESLMEEDEGSFGGDSAEKADGEEMTFEEFFGSSDLGDTEGEAGEAGEGEDADAAAGDEGADAAEGDLDAELGGDAAGEGDEAAAAAEGDEPSLDDMKSAIAELQAEFKRLQAEIDGGNAGGEGSEDGLGGDTEGSEGSEDGMDGMGGDAEGAEGAADGMGDDEAADDKAGDDFFEQLDALLGEDFADLTEGAVDELEVVNHKNTHAFVGAGGAEGSKVNNTSPIPQKPRDKRVGGEPVKVKAEQKSGYDREAAPGTKAGTGAKNPSNVKGKAANGQTKVKKDGDSAALLNKSEGFGEEGKKSPFTSMGTKGLQK